MEKLEYRAVIKFFVKEGLSPNEIHQRFVKVYKQDSPSYSTVKKWAAEFKRGRESIEDDPCEGRPKSATTPELIDRVHDMVLEDRRVKLREIAEAVGISVERVGHILHKELHMNKLCAIWVPRILTPEQKRNRMTMSQHALELYNKNPADFLRRFITIDETWIHHYTPESKQQSKQWTEAGSSAPKEAKPFPPQEK